jgi:precorrin-2 dehydrogenase / sirohydrochlorin ferrochelatase
MIPIYLDPDATRVALIGRGALAVRRLDWLKKLGAKPVVFSDAPGAELREAAGFLLAKRLPEREELRAFQAIWIADIEPEDARTLSVLAREEGVLINVEDVKPLCNFHTPAVVKRGKLVLAAGTGGASPAAASAVREKLEEMFGEEWEAALDELAAAREVLRAGGAKMSAITEDARARLKRRALVRA